MRGAAGDENGDAHQLLKTAIQAQLDAENSEIAAKFDAVSSSEPFKTHLQAGLEAVSTRTKEIFGLGESEGGGGREQRESAAAGEVSSEFPFTGGGGVPDFTATEGIGKGYGELGTGYGDFMEKDHIIAKQIPLAAQGSTLLSPADHARVTSHATAMAPEGLSEAQRGRLAALAGESLFSAGATISSYTERSGYAIPLYRPIHREVTAETAAGERATVAEIQSRSGAALNTLASYVISGEASDLESGKSAVHDDIRRKMLASTDAHGNSIASKYSAEIARVRAANTAPNQAEAQRHMNTIAGNVSASLAEARQKTEALF